MSPDIQKEFERQNSSAQFIKTTDIPASGLTSEQKAVLNRKGNVCFNQGDMDAARRIFITTGYSDGLTRIADVLLQQGKELEALKLYWLAHNKRQTEPLFRKMADIISEVIK